MMLIHALSLQYWISILLKSLKGEKEVDFLKPNEFSSHFLSLPLNSISLQEIEFFQLTWRRDRVKSFWTVCVDNIFFFLFILFLCLLKYLCGKKVLSFISSLQDGPRLYHLITTFSGLAIVSSHCSTASLLLLSELIQTCKEKKETKQSLPDVTQKSSLC